MNAIFVFVLYWTREEKASSTLLWMIHFLTLYKQDPRQLRLPVWCQTPSQNIAFYIARAKKYS